MEHTGVRLTVVEGLDKGTELLLNRPADAAILIGREVDPQRGLLICNDLRVSRLHAKIEPCSEGYRLVDLSQNGTLRNGELLQREEPVLLHSGDELHFGPDTVARFEEIALNGGRDREPRPRLREEPRDRTPTPPRRVDPVKEPAPEPIVLEDAAPTERFGRFAIHRTLVTSDVDRIDVAVDESSGQEVALKRITSKLITKNIKREILNEVGRARDWDHPAIAHLAASGEQDGTLFVAQEYIDGESLAALHQEHAAAMPPLLCAYIAREACAAIAYILERDANYVHRYLSPRCFMLGRDGRLVLINYGCPPYEVRVGGSQSGNRFLANEAKLNKPLDARSDVCSLGRVLYELLSQQQINPRVPVLPDVATIQPDTPPGLAQIANKAVKIHPAQRYATAAVMAEALRDVLQDLDPRYGASAAAEWMRQSGPAPRR